MNLKPPTKIFAPLFFLLFSTILTAETVDIEYVQTNREMRTCVGVLYSPELCITVGHLTDFVESEPVIIKRNRRAINGTVILVDKGADISIVKMEKSLEIPTITFSEGISEGDEVLIDCFDKSRKLSLNGYGIEPLTNTKFLLFKGKTVESGMSGSPVYDNKGRLASIISGYLHDSERRSTGCMPIHIKEAIKNAREKMSK